ncbi:hypothetical protein BT96DRAFT_951270 [Gymnopus androsaceus JB14]|uniref:Uncharacterized protein n=1 Tax=Gymnopus androsaceus JB14 TaxID=1447944 RepID=A0A6A4GD99_9AGAR|nr:hypothetical protein BT96DRAFT_951270 [Gymnopus androsaceus JB14]
MYSGSVGFGLGSQPLAEYKLVLHRGQLCFSQDATPVADNGFAVCPCEVAVQTRWVAEVSGRAVLLKDSLVYSKDVIVIINRPESTKKKQLATCWSEEQFNAQLEVNNTACTRMKMHKRFSLTARATVCFQRVHHRLNKSGRRWKSAIFPGEKLAIFLLLAAWKGYGIEGRTSRLKINGDEIGTDVEEE